MAVKQIQYHGLWIKFLVVVAACAALVWFVLQGLQAPVQQNDVCKLFHSHPSWYWSAKSAERKWGVPVSEQMAIIQKESHFRSAARPPHQRLLGFIPWQRISSATGYMQALDATWRSYLHATGQHSASRSDFVKATDFIGWYINDAHRRTGINKRDAFHNYLIYHEGVGGFLAHSYRSKPWLVGLAKRVAWRAERYHQQLLVCAKNLAKKPWWRFW